MQTSLVDFKGGAHNERILNTRSQPVKATLSSNDKKRRKKGDFAPLSLILASPPPKKKPLKCGKLPIGVVYVSEKCHPRLTVSTLSRSNIGA